MLLATGITFSPSQSHEQQQYESWCSNSPTVTWNRVMDLSIFATSLMALAQLRTIKQWSPKGNDHVGCFETLSLPVYDGVHGCGICVVHARTSRILLHAQSQGLSADLRPTTLSFWAVACCALQSLVKSLKFETSCDLQEAGAGTLLNDSILFACHRISCNINLHTTIADHWHVEHLLASQILAHQLGFGFIWQGRTCTLVESHIVNS